MKRHKFTPILIDAYPPFEGFPPEGIRFLQRLRKNNNREWFEKHKEEYEALVKLPMQSLIYGLQPYFSEFAPEFEVNPQRSLFRIYRDVRFSRDKSPYKTHVAAHFVLRGKPKGTSGLGYYVHVEPGECYIGGGLYIPDSEQLKKIRRAIDSRQKDFRAIVEDEEFCELFLPLEGEQLQRVPRGYSEDHPLANWLKFKQFYIGITTTHKEALTADFMNLTVRVFRTATPWIRFLMEALR